MHRISILALLLLASLAVPAFAAGIVNGDFEADTIKPWGWSKTDKCLATGQLDQAEKHGGKQSFKMTSRSPLEANVYATLDQALDLEAGKTYQVSLWCKGKGVGHCWAGGGEGWKQRTRLPTGDFDWTRITFSIKTGEQPGYTFRINVDSATEALWIDDVEIVDPDAGRPSKPAVLSTPGLSPSARIYPIPASGLGPVLRLRSSQDAALGADAQIGYDQSGVQFDVRVLDPSPGVATAGEGMWLQDCIQLAIDTDPGTAKPGYGGSCFELGFALLPSGEVARYAWHSGGGPFDFDRVQAEGQRESDGYRLRVHIGWQALGLKPPESRPVLGLNLVVSHGDTGKGRQTVAWTPGVVQFKAPNEFARLIPVANEAASLADLRSDQAVYGREASVALHYGEYAFAPSGEGTLSVVARPADRPEVPLSEVKLPAVGSGQTREALWKVPASSLPEGKYVLEVRLGSRAVASTPVERLDMATRIPARLSSLQGRYQELVSAIDTLPGAGRDEYLRLAQAVIQRYLERVQTGGPGGRQDIRWSWLQLNEIEAVIAQATVRLEELRDGSASPWVTPASTSVKLEKGGVTALSGDGSSRPAFLYGYGHYGQVIKDLPSLATMGVTLVQQEIGPRALSPDGVLGGDADRVVANLRAASAKGVRVDLLLSPHYFPAWAMAQSPDLAVNNGASFLKYNIDHPQARSVIESYLRKIVPLVRNEPGLFSFCLANEPVYRLSGADPYSRPAWAQYLKARHSSIQQLNALYGTQYADFADVPAPAPASASASEAANQVGQQRARFDWLVFNQEHLASWLSWMNGLVKQSAPEVPTHVKVMAEIFNAARLSDGTDPELISGITDLAGNDCGAMPTGDGAYAYRWKLENAWYELLHSFGGQAVFNSENHLIRDGAPPQSISPDHTHAVLWEGGLHHQAATTIWVWEEAGVPDLAGSIYFRPANAYAAGKAMLDLHRLAPEVTALNQHRAQVAILYAVPSIYWQDDYTRSTQDVSAAVQFLGQPVTFISERQLAARRRSPANEQVQWIVVPHATHVRQETRAALEQFCAGGGNLILLGDDCLQWDEYHRPLAGALPGSVRVLKARTDERALAAALLPIFTSPSPSPSGGLNCGFFTDAQGKPAFGVEYRAVPFGKGQLVSLTNHLQTPLLGRLFDGKGAAPDLLHSQSVDLAAVSLAPMQSRLLYLPAGPRQ
jgi:hypothetical protein